MRILSKRKRHAEIAGAGFAGLTAAAALARNGWTVRVHEQADAVRTLGAGIYIYENGLRIFDALGIYEQVTAGAHPAHVREMRNERNETLLAAKWSPAPENRVFAIVRQRCIDGLAGVARAAGADIVTSSTAIGASADGHLQLADGSSRKADLVVAADGVHSKVRNSFNLIKRQRLLLDGAIRTLIPRNDADRASADASKSIEYWSGTRRVLYTACSNDEIYLALTALNADVEATRAPFNKDVWKRSFPYIADMLGRVDEHSRFDPFQYIRLHKWSAGRVVFVGDSAHAMPPNIGQGGGCAMMNALSLATVLEEFENVETGLAAWERRERWVTERAQRTSMWLGAPTTWSPRLRSLAFLLAGRSRWIVRQRMKTAHHVPTGTTRA